MISDIRRRSVVAMVALGLGGLVAAWLSGPSSAPEVTITGEQRVQAGTLRDAVDQLAARHRLRIVIDPAVRSDGPVTLDATFASLPVEAQLQRLFAGHELLLHHTADRGSGARLAAAWVFARAEDVTVVPRSAATTAALTFAPPAPAAAAAVTTETARPAPPRAESADAEAPPLTLHTLRRLVEQDVSDAERVQALEALAAHPEAGDAELRQLLEQLGAQPHTLLGEQARALLDARTGAITALAPEPLEQ